MLQPTAVRSVWYTVVLGVEVPRSRVVVIRTTFPIRVGGARAHFLPSRSRVLHEGGTRSVHAVGARMLS